MALIFGREARRARRHPVLAYAVPAVPPLIAVTLFSDMMSPAAGLPGFPASTYQDYMAPGAVLLAGMMFAGYTAISLAEDRRSGFSDRLRLLGVSRRATTTGRLLFEAVRIVPAAVAAYVVALALGDDLGASTGRVVSLLVFVMLWTMAYNAIFLVVAHRSRRPQAVIALQPLFAPLTFPSTFWFPGELMPQWGETATGWSPLSWIADAARTLIAGPVDAGSLLVGSAAVFVVGASSLVILDRIGLRS